MRKRTLKLAKANISRVLKAAHFTKSEWIRSRRIPGHGRRIEGFEIDIDNDGRFIVKHSADSEERVTVQLKRYSEALAAEFATDIKDEAVTVNNAAIRVQYVVVSAKETSC